MAIALSHFGLGPLVSGITQLGVQAIKPGRLGSDPEGDEQMQADTVTQLLGIIRSQGGVPLDRALVRVQPGMMLVDGEYLPVAIWDVSIAYAP